MKMHKPPFTLKEVKVELTHACLLKCVHCSSLADDLCTRQMTMDQCRRIITEASSMGVRDIAFSGGEPLLWRGLSHAVNHASSAGMEVSIYSTGNVDDATAIFDSLKIQGLSRVMFSVYSKTSNIHENITQVEGSLDKTFAAAQQCVSLGLHVEFHFVPMLNNYRELRGVVERARDMGVNRVSVLRLVPQGRASNYEKLQLKYEEHLALRQTMTDLIKEGHDIRVGSPFNILRMRKNPECCAGVDRMTISPDLTIAPCDAFKQITPEMIGVSEEYSSLTDVSLSDCWQKSPYLNKIREYLTTPFAKECGGCSTLKNCLSGCVAQKYHAYGNLTKQRDPMCMCSGSKK